MLSAKRVQVPIRRIAPLALVGTTLAVIACGEPRGREESKHDAPSAPQVDWQAVEQVLGRPGVMQPGDVRRFGFPRTDLAVTVNGIRLKPAFALGAWVAFRATNAGAMVMGDLVLCDDEIEPVMAKLTEGGVAVTALHHHLLHETPRVYYMHIHGAGDAVTLAQTIRAAVGLTRRPSPQLTPSARSASPVGLDTGRIAQALGHAGKLNGTVYQVNVPRSDTIREHQVVIPPAMGVATALNFQPAAGGMVASTGDFVLRGAEVNPVLRALHEHGIQVTAIHNHTLDEEPRLFFVHFWAVGEATQLARGLRAALDAAGGVTH